MNNRNEELAKTVKELCWFEPFWGLFLMGFRKSWSRELPTACVSKNGINYALTINEDFFEGLERDHRKGILQHECMHIGYFHLERHGEFENKELANIAMDIVVNQDCKPEWLPCKNMSKEEFAKKYEPIMKGLNKDLEDKKITLDEYRKEIHKVPPRGVYLEDFAELKLKPKESTRYYYDALLKDSKKKSGGSQFLKSLLQNSMFGPEGPLGHKMWKDFENLSEAEKKLLKSQLEYHLKEVADQVTKSRGTVPAGIAGYLEGMDKEEPPKFDWKGYLRRFTGGSTKTYTKKLRRKFNKRFEDNPGLRIKTRKHVLLAVDTSGSVSDLELKEFFHEIDHISRTGTQITVVQCDAAIHDISPYKKGCADKIKIKGRGGTDFVPIINYSNENLRKFTCLIIFTDGEAPAPDESRLRTLWVHSSKSNINESLPGWKIKLSE